MSAGDRFAFGENWRRFLNVVDEERIGAAAQSLRAMLEVEDLSGRRFLDVGCGSGLFSLAARRLGARVRAFDFDAQSVACARELKQRYCAADLDWQIEAGSVLDREYLATLGQFDVVYAWGVLHHTGAMWDALENVGRLVSAEGRLCVAIYNDQGTRSRWWRRVKQTYHRLPRWLRPCLPLALAAARCASRAAVTLAAVAARLISIRNPLVPLIAWFKDAKREDPRGMHWWHDLVDWVGGYPFEVAKPEAVFRFFRGKGFGLTYLTTQGCGHGCNEFVFAKPGAS